MGTPTHELPHQPFHRIAIESPFSKSSGRGRSENTQPISCFRAGRHPSCFYFSSNHCGNQEPQRTFQNPSTVSAHSNPLYAPTGERRPFRNGIAGNFRESVFGHVELV